MALKVARRGILRIAFWSSLGAGVLAIGGAAARFFYPNESPDDGVIFIHAKDVPAPGDPPWTSAEGRFHLVNLIAGEGLASNQDAHAPGGLLALSWKCTHLGCATPWRGDEEVERTVGIRGIFDCPCHGAQFTKAGIRVYGPAPRSMDTFRVEVVGSRVKVDTHSISPGTLDNPSRAVPWTPPS